MISVTNYTIELPPEKLVESYEIGLVITTYNRPKYLQRTLRSLKRSDLKNCIILLVDDVSDDPQTRHLIQTFLHPHAPVIRAWRKNKKGVAMYENLQFGWEWLLSEYECRYLCNLDPDVILKPYWLQTLFELYRDERPRLGPCIATGFNALYHNISNSTATYHTKKSIGGINMFFDADLYADIAKPCFDQLEWGLGWDWKFVEAMQAKNYPIICTRPSVIQHIGRNGVWAKSHAQYDFALDYWFQKRPFTTLTHYYFLLRQKSSFWLNHTHKLLTRK